MMSDIDKISRPDQRSLREAMHVQALETNPLDAGQVAMFEMFDREGWSDERRRAYLRHHVLERVGVPAAE